MKNEKIYFLGKNLGLSKFDINQTLKNVISKNNILNTNGADCYKNGTMYGVVSSKDL
jgi:hypothetical protein